MLLASACGHVCALRRLVSSTASSFATEVLESPPTALLQGGWSVCNLDLSYNSLCAAGGLAIFEALKTNPMQSLRSLKLTSCKLSSVELGVCIGKVLGAGEALCMLQELDIGWNDFDDVAMQVQAVLLSHLYCCISTPD